MPLPGGATGWTLTFGAYSDPAFVGMKGILRLPVARVHIATGAVVQQSWTVTIGGDGTGSIADLPYTDDAAFTGTGQPFSMQWQALSYKPTPGDKTFTVNQADGATIDFDLLPSTVTPVASGTSGMNLANLDSLLAGLVATPGSAVRAAVLDLPTYPNGA